MELAKVGDGSHFAAAEIGEVLPNQPLRFLFYSHDSCGLGHLRRTLAIAATATKRFANASVLIVTGSPCATRFELPPRCDVVKLPAVTKDRHGSYIPRFRDHSLRHIIDLRSRLTLEAFRSYDPHLVLVDHKIVGLCGEALPMLREARAMGLKIVYGMRDVVDSPQRVALEWHKPECKWALQHGYDLLCIYGAPELYDPRKKYQMLRQHTGKTRFSGYVVGEIDMSNRAPVPAPKPNVLVTVGGGEDGQERIEAYLKALQMGPVSWTSHIIAGPLMNNRRVRQYKRVAHRQGMADLVKISRFHSNLPRLLQDSDAVVAMAGYNTCAEILQSRVPAVLMPRSFPRTEQLIRARRLMEMGLARCIETLDPGELRVATVDALNGHRSSRHDLPLDGAENLCDMFEELITAKQVAIGGSGGQLATRSVGKC